ncbi:MAG: hybrid sensor histidine kinase/response regulator [Myxococcales bacterium]|nr:hybrid sensor histidine kinase/response regulator [Myxococcales bacterium]
MSLVLIADDEEPTLEILSDVVGHLGHQVLEAHDGEEALTLARSHSPDLVITDFMMPRRSGIELIRALRSEQALAHTPVILISAASPRAAGEATLFLAKPLHLTDLEEEIKRLLRDRAPRPAAPMLQPAGVDAGKGPDTLNWVAHELKSPLSAARMSAELIRRRLELIGEEQDHSRIRVVLRGLDRMTDLINSVLDAAALNEGKVTLNRQRVDIIAFVARVVALWRDLHPEVDFALAAPKQSLELQIDETRLHQVLDNLLSNAVKYGGEQKRVEVEVQALGGQLVVSVRDHGRGIAAAEIPHLFQRFHRAEGNDGQGHGLGLFIAAAVAKLHGGTLSVKSERGAGSTFALSLPRAS